MKKKKTNKKNKRRSVKQLDEPLELKKAPHTFVIHRAIKSCKLKAFLVVQILQQPDFRSIPHDAVT